MKKEQQSSDDCFSYSDEDTNEKRANEVSFQGNKQASQKQNNLQAEEINPLSIFLDQLPPSQPIATKEYSLEADLILGWQPRLSIQGPVPLTFSQSLVNQLIQVLWRDNQNSDSYKLVYLGFRPSNSLKLHHQFANKSDQDMYPFKFKTFTDNENLILAALDIRQKKQFKMPFLGQNPLFEEQQTPGKHRFNCLTVPISTKGQPSTSNASTASTIKSKLNNVGSTQSQISPGSLSATVFSKIRQSTLKFDSVFESGNLDCAVQVDENEYDLFMRVDSNTKGHLQWYYFNVSGASPGQVVKFNICNFSKGKSLYSRGMKPYVSSNKSKSNLHKWKQGGRNIKFEKTEWRYPFLKEEQSDIKRKIFFTLSFEYIFEYYDETVSFAYCVPNTFSHLHTFLKNLITQSNAIDKQFLKEQKLCSSLSGLDVPLLTITDFNSSKEEIEKRKVIIVIGRIHPGESNSSFVMEGFLEFLFSDAADSLRKQCVLKVVPMMNPDGVVLGNYRTGMAGKDLNRIFKSGDRVVFPTVAALKDLVAEAKRVHGDNIFMFMDLHGHSVKKNVFAYGPDHPIFDPKYYTSRLFCKILSKTSEMFRYYSCIFRVSQMKRNTARGVFHKDFGVQNCFTIESSNGSYYCLDKTTQEFSPSLWNTVGNNIASSVREYFYSIQELEIWEQMRKNIRFEKNEESKKSQVSDQKKKIKVTSKLVIKTDCEELTSKENPRQKPSLPDSKFKDETNNLLNNKLAIDEKKINKPLRKKLPQKFLEKKSLSQVPFKLEESPLYQYFNKPIGEQEPERDSDSFSDKGQDSDSDEEDYDKTFIKNFKINLHTNTEIYKKFCQTAITTKTSPSNLLQLGSQKFRQKRFKKDKPSNNQPFQRTSLTLNRFSTQQKDTSPLPLSYSVNRKRKDEEQQPIKLKPSSQQETVRPKKTIISFRTSQSPHKDNRLSDTNTRQHSVDDKTSVWNKQSRNLLNDYLFDGIEKTYLEQRDQQQQNVTVKNWRRLHGESGQIMNQNLNCINEKFTVQESAINRSLNDQGMKVLGKKEALKIDFLQEINKGKATVIQKNNFSKPFFIANKNIVNSQDISFQQNNKSILAFNVESPTLTQHKKSNTAMKIMLDDSATLTKTETKEEDFSLTNLFQRTPSRHFRWKQSSRGGQYHHAMPEKFILNMQITTDAAIASPQTRVFNDSVLNFTSEKKNSFYTRAEENNTSSGFQQTLEDTIKFLHRPRSPIITLSGQQTISMREGIEKGRANSVNFFIKPSPGEIQVKRAGCSSALYNLKKHLVSKKKDQGTQNN